MDQVRRIRDEWLALRCQAEEPGAIEQLVEELQRPLLYYALKLTGNPDTAQEVLQEAWIQALRGLRKLKDPSSVRSWLYRIVHGLAVDRVRRDITRERIETLDYNPADEVSDTWLTEQAVDTVHVALDALTPKHREVLVLFFLEQFSIAEIAKVTGCAEGTVKSRLHHAKNALREIISSDNSHEQNK